MEASRTPEKPLVRMCSSRNFFSNFADIGDTVTIFVDFGHNFRPNPRQNQEPSLHGATAGREWPDQEEQSQYEIKLAGLQAFLHQIKPKDKFCSSFRAKAKILLTDEVLENPSGLVKFVIPFCSRNGDYLGEVTEEDTEYHAKYRVYHQLLWNDLIDHNQDVRTEMRLRSSSRLSDTTYGSMGRQRRSLRETLGQIDEVDAGPSHASAEVITDEEQIHLLQRPPAKRYWPDSWEMKFWRHSCCDSLLRSRNCFARFWATFFVAPLTNVTGLSLYYQLYLTEIFHLRFGTKMGHYICMPLIVTMMMAFFTQWRFDHGCYTLADTEVLIPNGAAVFATVLFLWYLIWGLVQGAYLMGIFMMLPLGLIYILGNIIFQEVVKISPKNNFTCRECWNHTQWNDYIRYFSVFELVDWYLNPLFWVGIFCFLQALSHIFEPKIPPRVNQTAHWMSCGDMFKKYGYSRSFVLLIAQAIFGTVDELLASARLLPLLNLRICYTLGYQAKQWEVLQILVQKSLQYGDPALDYIGTGGAEYLPEDSIIPTTSNSKRGSGKQKRHEDSTGYNIAELKKQLKEMEETLTEDHHKLLKDPLQLSKTSDDWLEHYVVLRHYVAKYELQVHAYGPFRTNEQNDKAEDDNRRMERDFPKSKHRAFRKFLNEVRFHLWMMEDEMMERRALCICCENEV